MQREQDGGGVGIDSRTLVGGGMHASTCKASCVRVAQLCCVNLCVRTCIQARLSGYWVRFSDLLSGYDAKLRPIYPGDNAIQLLQLSLTQKVAFKTIVFEVFLINGIYSLHSSCKLQKITIEQHIFRDYRMRRPFDALVHTPKPLHYCLSRASTSTAVQ